MRKTHWRRKVDFELLVPRCVPLTRVIEETSDESAPSRSARPAPGISLLAMIPYAKHGEHQPLNWQSGAYSREGVDLSTLTNHAGAGARK